MSSVKNKNTTYRTVLSAMFLALAVVLPFLTGQIPQIGSALCPMHIPVLLCGYFCGPAFGFAVGFIAPLLRFALFGMPVLMPAGIAMCFELAAYGLVSALLYRALPGKKQYIWVSLVAAMLAGRVIWGLTRLILYGLGKSEFGLEFFITGAFAGAVPGIIIQLVVVPAAVLAFGRFSIREK